MGICATVRKGVTTIALFAATFLAAIPSIVEANPVFARQYNMSCVACHAAFPRLNSFGQSFLNDNIRMPGWREQVAADTGDDALALPKAPPIAFRAQTYGQIRSAKVIDENTGATLRDARYDFQGPYLLKLFSAAPLSDHMSYYFYGILAEKGANGEVIVEDAWLRYDDIIGTGVGLTAGQYQLSDLMFPRETRLTFQDFIPYRMAGITYERGAQLERDFGPLSLAAGAVNGNGITSNAPLNSAGFGRPDRAFDDNRAKTFYGRIGGDLGPLRAGFFIADGKRRNAADSAFIGNRVYGLDFSSSYGDRLFGFVQLLRVQWDDFLTPGDNSMWYGGFAGVDYVLSERWALSLLYNYANANDLKDSGTVFEGIDLNSLSGTVSYYFMRNVKAIVEINGDLLATDTRNGVGHDTKEHYVLAGFDVAF